jgi:hypothetical protein
MKTEENLPEDAVSLSSAVTVKILNEAIDKLKEADFNGSTGKEKAELIAFFEAFRNLKETGDITTSLNTFVLEPESEALDDVDGCAFGQVEKVVGLGALSLGKILVKIFVKDKEALAAALEGIAEVRESLKDFFKEGEKEEAYGKTANTATATDVDATVIAEVTPDATVATTSLDITTTIVANEELELAGATADLTLDHA